MPHVVRYNLSPYARLDNQPLNRSEQRIPRLRTRGRENRRRLLAEAERLLLESDGTPLRFSDVFEAADVSRGSAYRIYNGVDDLLQDLAAEWTNNFADYLTAIDMGPAPENWAELSDTVVQRGADYWADTANTLKVLPQIRSNAPASYRQAVCTLSDCLAVIFNRHFVIPEVPGWLAKLGFFTQICDLTFADAVRNDGYISKERRVEAEILCRTYLATHLPARLPVRSQVHIG